MGIYNTKITCDGCALFDSNTAKTMGGGALIISNWGNERIQDHQSFKSAIFVNNEAHHGGGIATLQTYLTLLGNVSLFNNIAGILDGTGSLGLGGAIYSYNTTLIFFSKCGISENLAFDGGGLYGSKITVIVDGITNIEKNYAVTNGGGLYLASGSEVWLNENTYLLLSRNYAGEFGGAVYIRDDPFFYCTNKLVITAVVPNCLFQSARWRTTATIHMLNNHAGDAGSAVYGGLLNNCSLNAWFESSYNGTDLVGNLQWIFPNFSNHRVNGSSLISSDPTKVCLCSSVGEPYCNVTKHNVTAFPGGTVHIPVVAIGQSKGSVPSVITAVFVDPGVVMAKYQDTQSSNKTCTNLEYTIFLKRGYDVSRMYTMSLLPELPCHSDVLLLQVSIELLPCPIGFDLSLTEYQTCVCTKRVQKYANTCDIDTREILRHGPYWVGWDVMSTGPIVHPHCPFDYCKSNNISFPMNDTNEQCQHSRAGLLCGGCKQGHSLAFGNSRCLKCSSDSYLALMLAFTIAGVILVLFLLFCKLTVAMGTINGLIFYANIVAVNQALYFPKHKSEGHFLRTFIAWINLDLGIEACFYDGMDMYTWTWLQFVFPFYIWTLVGIVIVLCHYFSWATRLFGRNPVAVLATLFLLSYTKLLRTIITAMSFTYLDYPDNPRVAVWLHDGNVRYLKGKHIALFIAALLTLLLLFLPYTSVILTRQWIEARSHHMIFKWISSHRVKPFLDAYHGPLKNQCRYWPGLLLISRSFLLLVFAFNAFGDPSINLLATIACTAGLLTVLVFSRSVYKHIGLYVLEVAFILNTLVLAACTMAPAVGERDQLTLTYSSVGITFVVFIGIIVYHCMVQVRDTRIWKDVVKPRLKRKQDNQSCETLAELDHAEEDTGINSRPETETVVTRTSISLRELMLEDEQRDIELMQ